MEIAAPLWRDMLKEFDAGHIWQVSSFEYLARSLSVSSH